MSDPLERCFAPATLGALGLRKRFDLIDFTRTSLGSGALRARLSEPLSDTDAIRAHHEALRFLRENRLSFFAGQPEVEAVVALQGVSVFLAKKGYLEHVAAAGLPALKDLVNTFLEAGGKLLICTPCIRDRHIDESDLMEGSELIAAARLNQEILSANSTLVY